MLIDFNAQEERVFHGMNGGEGEVCAKMYVNSSGKVIVSRIAPESSIGLHTQNTSNDINFVVSGTGRAVCDGAEDLVLYTVVQEL